MQVFLMVAMLMAGLLGLLRLAEPVSIDALLTPALALVWKSCLLVSGALGVLAAMTARSSPATSLVTERLAVSVVGVFSVLYAFAIVGRSGVSGVSVALFLAAYGLACAVRYWQIRTTVRYLHRQAQRT